MNKGMKAQCIQCLHLKRPHRLRLDRAHVTPKLVCCPQIDNFTWTHTHKMLLYLLLSFMSFQKKASLFTLDLFWHLFYLFIYLFSPQSLPLSTWQVPLTVQSFEKFPSHPSHTVPYAMSCWERGLKDELSWALAISSPVSHRRQLRQRLVSTYVHVSPSQATGTSWARYNTHPQMITHRYTLSHFVFCLQGPC